MKSLKNNSKKSELNEMVLSTVFNLYENEQEYSIHEMKQKFPLHFEGNVTLLLNAKHFKS